MIYLWYSLPKTTLSGSRICYITPLENDIVNHLQVSNSKSVTFVETQTQKPGWCPTTCACAENYIILPASSFLAETQTGAPLVLAPRTAVFMASSLLVVVNVIFYQRPRLCRLRNHDAQ